MRNKRVLFRKKFRISLMSQVFFHIVVPQAVMAIQSYVLKTTNIYEIHLCLHNSQSFVVDLSKFWISKQLCLIDCYPEHLIQVLVFLLLKISTPT